MKSNPGFSRALAPVVSVLVACGGQVFAAGFLAVPGVKGDSVDPAHQGKIDVSGFSWGLDYSSTAGGSGGSRGKPTFRDFTITKKADQSSPKLMQACAIGKLFPQIELQVTEGPAGSAVYYTVKLENVQVTSFHTDKVPRDTEQGGTADPAPSESISFSFTRVVFSYDPGDGTGLVTVSYDLVTGS